MAEDSVPKIKFLLNNGYQEAWWLIGMMADEHGG